MFKRTLPVFLIVVAGCQSGPTTPALPLSLSHSAATIARNESLSLTATLLAGTAGTDVTAKAAWTSSNPAVIAVEGGTLRGVGPGTATVTASYHGRSAALPVTVRRNTAIGGVIAMRETTGRRPFGALQLLRGQEELGGRGGSDHGGSERQEARYGWTAGASLRARSHVEPGPLALTLRITVFWMHLSGTHHIATEDLSYVEVFDADTGESLERFNFPRTEATVVPSVTPIALVPVTLTIKAYTQ